MLRRLHLPVALNLAHVLLLTADQCAKSGRPDLASAPKELAAKAGAVKLEVYVSAAGILCAAVDEARKRGDRELHDELEQLVQFLKEGQDAHIIGTIQRKAGASPGEIYGAAERLAKDLIGRAGG